MRTGTSWIRSGSFIKQRALQNGSLMVLEQRRQTTVDHITTTGFSLSDLPKMSLPSIPSLFFLSHPRLSTHCRAVDLYVPEARNVGIMNIKDIKMLAFSEM
ncbi:hypothetical protein SLE2022_218810 [Rubroshorea leprosula]